MIIEPQPGDRVRFRESGALRLGTVVDVVSAGRAAGRGVWRLRRRARIRFEREGRHWETHRDLDDVSISEVAEQPSLFAEEPVA